VSRVPEIRCLPADASHVGPVRLVGFVPGYAVVRRSGRTPFVVPRKTWDAAPVITREQEAAFDFGAAYRESEAQIVASINRGFATTTRSRR